MKIAVMGAGAVGCYYGGMLARAGHEVVLIGRAQHVEAIRHAGLFMDTHSFQAYVPVQADTEPSGVKGAKLVLCCVKFDRYRGRRCGDGPAPRARGRGAEPAERR